MAKRKRRQQRGKRGDGYVTYDASKARYKAAYPLGNRRYRSRFFHREEEAQAWLTEQRRLAAAKIAHTEPTQLFETWLAQVVSDHARNLRPTTRAYYAECCKYINGALPDGIRLCDVTIPHIRAMDQTLRAGRTKHFADVCLWLTDKALAHAIEYGYVTQNAVVSYRKITTARSRGGRPPKPITAHPIDVCRAALVTSASHRYAALCRLLLTLPLRLGEVTGLRWSDLELQHGRLHIRQQITTEPTKGRQLPPSDPKSAAGVRTLPVPPLLIRALRAHADRSIGEGWPADGLVFHAPGGQPLYGTLVRRLLRDWGIPGPHRARHTVLTHLSGAVGCDVTILRSLAGHSGRSVTERYVHHDVDALRPWVEAWERTLDSAGRMARTGD